MLYQSGVQKMNPVTKKTNRSTLSSIRDELDEQKKFNAYILTHLENIYNKFGDTIESAEENSDKEQSN